MFDYAVFMPGFPRGRGTALNPANRFEEIAVEWDGEADPAERPAPATRFYKDATKSILTRNDSPDIPFTWSLNPYRGCEHGCSYCYARHYHEYLGLSSGLDFETKIFVKEDAPVLLERELSKPSFVPDAIAMSGITDCYQPVERKLEITRGCLKVMLDARCPVGIVTKNALVTRDADLLGALARHGAARVFVSVTTLDGEMARRLEPRASTPLRRLEAIRELARAGVEVGVMAAPMIPGLNDHELPAILEAAAEAGASSAGYTVLRLPYSVKQVFLDWLEREEAGRRDKVVSQVRDLRGGELNDPRFKSRMRGEGIYAEHLAKLFAFSCRRFGLDKRRKPLDVSGFRRPAGAQLRLI